MIPCVFQELQKINRAYLGIYSANEVRRNTYLFSVHSDALRVRMDNLDRGPPLFWKFLAEKTPTAAAHSNSTCRTTSMTYVVLEAVPEVKKLVLG
jgi:hypothetical protein